MENKKNRIFVLPTEDTMILYRENNSGDGVQTAKTITYTEAVKKMATSICHRDCLDKGIFPPACKNCTYYSSKKPTLLCAHYREAEVALDALIGK